MKTFGAILLVILGAGAFVALNSFYIVSQTQQAIVLQFGDPVKVVTDPGLKYKIPFVQNVEYFDKRILELDSQPQEVIASDQKRLVVDAFARYRIINPLLYYQTVRNEIGASSRLDNIIDSTLRRVLGTAKFSDVVRDQREELMMQVATTVNADAKNLGMEIVDVRIKRADLPEPNSQAIFRRMQTERQRESFEIRAQGSEAAQTIKSNADRQVTILIAEANRDAEQTRGEGDGLRNKIYADAFSKDPNFFSFYRSMQAYEEALKAGDTRMVLSPNSEFFKFFNNPSGLPTPGAAPAPPAPR
ncbi:MAG: protease modulator HflC [Chitinophagales bacterium]|nr:protease modulator HflC [Hyphomicrobiales bacterium]